MIVRPKPTTWQLLFILRGSILPAITRRLVLIALLSLAAATVAESHPTWFHEGALAPFTLVGLTLSIFLSFRNNACYERWWEARKQWGQLIVECRSLARDSVALFDDATRQRVIRRCIGFVHALASRLRASEFDTAQWLDAVEWERVSSQRNLPDALLREQSAELAQLLRTGRISDIVYSLVDHRISAMAGIQAACERILTTPLPFAYTLLLHRTALAFCVLLPFGLAGALGWATPVVSIILAYALFGLDALGDELEEPFGLAANDLPLAALTRVIEIDLLEALGEKDLPQALVAKDFVLR